MAEEIITSTNVETATDHEYNASEIQVLKGLEAVRKRPGMYIGSTGERGLHHLVYEIVDNAIDEALAGYCNHIEVKILKNNIIQVTDNGRGIPVDIQADTGLPAVTVVYTILHAGGKFGGENSGYKVAGGLHGVGSSVVNALSVYMDVQISRDGYIHHDRYERGKPVIELEDGLLPTIGKTRKTGKEIRNFLFFKYIKPGGTPSGFLFVNTARNGSEKTRHNACIFQKDYVFLLCKALYSIKNLN